MKKDYSLNKYVNLMQKFYDVLEPDCREMTAEQLSRLAAECRKVTRKNASVAKYNAAQSVLYWVEFESDLRSIVKAK